VRKRVDFKKWPHAFEKIFGCKQGKVNGSLLHAKENYIYP
jgi:hypothetical protein